MALLNIGVICKEYSIGVWTGTVTCRTQERLFKESWHKTTVSVDLRVGSPIWGN